ncbi:MAG: hypothetical protein EOP01_08290, partial [Propionibacteriaceae bacterium]
MVEYKCVKCKKIFYDKSIFDRHINRKTDCIKVKYTCKKCNKIFENKATLDKHFDRKTDCTKTKYEHKKEKKENKCKECNKEFTRAYSLKRHMNVCKGGKVIKTTVNGDKNKIYNDCTINKNTIIKNLNINLVVFGKEGVENISHKDLVAILTSKTSVIESLIEKINCNPDKPQYHNIYYSDMKSGYGDIYG